MTSYAAYDAHEPCKNPNCKSFGKPHPNCRCYGSFADGGEVQHFCANNLPHHKLCKHYAAGGEVDLSNVMQHSDPQNSVASYLGHSGAHGLIDYGMDPSDQSIMKYNQDVKRGNKDLHARVNNVFDGVSSDKPDLTKAKKKIEDWVDQGGVTSEIKDEMHRQSAESYAGGGHVERKEGLPHDHHIAQAYPSQNLMLQATKARISNYLMGIKPQKNTPKLAYDDEPDDTAQKKSYDRALKIAAHPLRVLDKIHDGTLEPEHLKHFGSMYPELGQELQKKMTQRIIDDQLEHKKPSYKARQGLSMFMGVPLSGELSPGHIQAAQATFQMQKQAAPQGQPDNKPKKDTSKLSKSDQSYLTNNQSLVGRQQKQ